MKISTNIFTKGRMIKVLFLRDGGTFMVVENGSIQQDALSLTKYLARIQPEKHNHLSHCWQGSSVRGSILRVGLNEF